MALSPPAERQLVHNRAISVQGFLRADGMIDVDAHITDTKTYRKRIGDGEAPARPLHEMRVRITVDEHLAIVACEAETQHGPFDYCRGGAATMSRLVGLHIKAGFLRAAGERLRGGAGCTHLRELLQQMATVMLQTLWPIQAAREEEARARHHRGGRHASGNVAEFDGSARLLNTCYAYASDSPEIRRLWPHLYTGPDATAPEAAEAAQPAAATVDQFAGDD